MVQPFVTWHRICTSEEDYLDSLLRLLPRVSTWAGEDASHESGGPSEGIALKHKCPDKGLGTWTGRVWTQVSAVVWVFFTVAADACRAWPPSPRPGHPKGVRLKP